MTRLIGCLAAVAFSLLCWAAILAVALLLVW